MKCKYLTIVILAIVLTNIVSAQKCIIPTTVQEFNLKERVKSIRSSNGKRKVEIIHFDTLGYMTHYYYTDSVNRPSNDSEFKYNNAGQLLSYFSEYLNSSCEYSYNAKGQLVQYSVYTLEYGKDATTGVFYEKPDGNRIYRTSNEKSQVIADWRWYPASVARMWGQDENGRRKEWIEHLDERVCSHTSYEYNENGDISAIRGGYNPDNYNTISYTYDKNGNWIERTKYNHNYYHSEGSNFNKLVSFGVRYIVREIEYY